MDARVLETQLKQKFAPHSRWVVALSGGADSVALLRLLCSFREELSLTVYAAHVHHGLREAADGDLQFVRRLCRTLRVPLYSTRVHADRLAQEKGLSLEAAGRKCRYDFLLPLANRLKATVVTAHTLNDQAETMLLYLIRGNGPEGLAGIREWREDGVFRPLLDYTKEELLFYLETLHQPHREDESNATDAFLRNRIRHELLPLLTAYNPSFLQGVQRTAKILQADNDYLQKITSVLTTVHADGVFPITAIQPLHTAVLHRLIRLAAKEFCGENNLSTTETEQIALLIQKGIPNKSRPIGKQGIVRICNESVNFSKTVEKPDKVWYNITVPQKVETSWTTLSLTLTDHPRQNEMVLDYDKVGKNLVLRSRQEGDRIAIGAGQHQKVSDLLINRKVPQEERDRVLLLCDEQNVLAVYPYRIAYHAAVNQNTKRFLTIAKNDKER